MQCVCSRVVAMLAVQNVRLSSQPEAWAELGLTAFWTSVSLMDKKLAATS